MRVILGIAALFVLAVPCWAQSDLAFPHIAVGGPYETVVQVANEVAADNSIVIEVFRGRLAGSANGTPFPVRFDNGAPASSRAVTLHSYQEMSTVLTLQDSTVQNGWVRIRSTTAGGKMSGNLIFRQRESGKIADSVGVASSQRFRYAVIQIDEREEGAYTGVAFVNPGLSAVTVAIDLYQADKKIGSFAQTLEPNQHFARLMTEVFPGFSGQQGTAVITTTAGTSVPILALRLDGIQLTSIPVRPLGFVFRYEVKTPGDVPVETGFWMFDFADFDLTGLGRRDTDPPGAFYGVRGNWLGNSFQFTRRIELEGGTFGMVVFNGTSSGKEATDGSRITGKVTTTGADGQAVSTNNFSAYHLFSPQ